MVQHVRADPDERQRGLAPGGRIVEAVEVDLPGLDSRVYRLGPVHPAIVRGHDRRQLDAPDEAEHVGLGKTPGDHPGQVARLFEAEDQRRDVAVRSRARCHDEHGVGILRGHPLGGTLEFEPVCENQVISLRRVGTESLVLLRRSPGLDVADREPQRIVDPLQAGVRARVPGRIGDAPRSDEADTDACHTGRVGACRQRH